MTRILDQLSDRHEIGVADRAAARAAALLHDVGTALLTCNGKSSGRSP